MRGSAVGTMRSLMSTKPLLMDPAIARAFETSREKIDTPNAKLEAVAPWTAAASSETRSNCNDPKPVCDKRTRRSSAIASTAKRRRGAMHVSPPFNLVPKRRARENHLVQALSDGGARRLDVSRKNG